VVGVVEEHCALLRAMRDEEMASHWVEVVELAALDLEFTERISPQAWATSHDRRLPGCGAAVAPLSPHTMSHYRNPTVLICGLFEQPSSTYDSVAPYPSYSGHLRHEVHLVFPLFFRH